MTVIRLGNQSSERLIDCPIGSIASRISVEFRSINDDRAINPAHPENRRNIGSVSPQRLIRLIFVCGCSRCPLGGVFSFLTIISHNLRQIPSNFSFAPTESYPNTESCESPPVPFVGSASLHCLKPFKPAPLFSFVVCVCPLSQFEFQMGV